MPHTCVSTSTPTGRVTVISCASTASGSGDAWTDAAMAVSGAGCCGVTVKVYRVLGSRPLTAAEVGPVEVTVVPALGATVTR